MIRDALLRQRRTRAAHQAAAGRCARRLRRTDVAARTGIRVGASDGWFPQPHAQLDIRCLGEFFLIDESEVPEIQQQMRDRSAQFA